jgi:hypothetical protein
MLMIKRELAKDPAMAEENWERCGCVVLFSIVVQGIVRLLCLGENSCRRRIVSVKGIMHYNCLDESSNVQRFQQLLEKKWHRWA